MNLDSFLFDAYFGPEPCYEKDEPMTINTTSSISLGHIAWSVVPERNPRSVEVFRGEDIVSQVLRWMVAHRDPGDSNRYAVRLDSSADITRIDGRYVDVRNRLYVL